MWPPVDLWVGPRAIRGPHTLPCSWNVRSVFTDAAPEQHCAVKIIGMVPVPACQVSLYINFKILVRRWRNLLILPQPKTSLQGKVSCIKTSTFPSGTAGLFLLSFLDLWVREPVPDFTREASDFVNQQILVKTVSLGLGFLLLLLFFSIQCYNLRFLIRQLAQFTLISGGHKVWEFYIRILPHSPYMD